MKKTPKKANVNPQKTAMDCIEEFVAAGGIRSITDPIAWQRETREDRALPNREI